MGYRMGRAAVAAALLAGAGLMAPSHAAPHAAGQNTELRLQVTGEVPERPDIGTIQAGVVTSAADAATALADNSRRMTSVVATLKKEGVAARDIQTSGVTVQAKYAHSQETGPKLTGFEATNRVRVVLRDLAKSGALLDALVKAGANSISGPDFGFDDSEPLADRARTIAIEKARKRADLYAKAAGLRVLRILSIEETAQRQSPRPMMRMASDAVMASPTPIEPGEASVSADIQVTFELGR